MPAGKRKQTQPRMALSTVLAITALTGGMLGLSAPGINQWYFAWFALAPLLLLTISAPRILDAFTRGLVFGAAYNLVYLNWYLQLHPLTWMGFNDLQSIAVATAAWIIVAMHQAVIVGLFAAIVRALPLCGGFLPRQVEERWKLPALLVIPPLWVILQNKLANAPDFLGVPWTMLEYSQYQVLPVIQAASWIGGIGIGAIIVLSNTVIATTLATISARLSWKSLAASTSSAALCQLLAVGLLIAGIVSFGYSELTVAPVGDKQTVSVLQGNINIEMQKHQRQFTLAQLSEHYGKLVSKAPNGLVVWSESSLPTYLKDEPQLLQKLADQSRAGKHDMIIGSLDKDFDGKPYNSAFGLSADGRLDKAVYHKRYLVPFGEYMPGFVKYLPEWVQRLTSTPAGVGFNSGKFPVVLDLSNHKVAPLICFETISPELCVTSVRNGGELLVNLSDLAWFHDSMVGDQMLAFSVLRAVETGRSFVFAANTGPSAIIDQHGRITARSGTGMSRVLSGTVYFSDELTPFTQWFR